MKIPHSYQLFTAKGSRKLDERTISEFGIDGFTLMEIAGTRAADFILQQVTTDTHGLFICGKGNNAGDALVVARILREHGIKSSVLFVSGMEGLSKDCSKNLKLLQKLDHDIHFYSSPDELPMNASFDFMIDGMLGTGLNSEVRSPYKKVIEWVNDQDFPVFAMDIPTGLCSDSGKVLGMAIKADYTLAFGTLKQGFFMNSGYEYCGEIIFCELPFPSSFKNSDTFLIDVEWVDRLRTSSPQRKHKYDGGVLYVIAGSEGLTGAAVLATKSAWSTGLGGVVLITPKGLLEIYEKNLVQIIKKPVGDSTDSYFSSNHLKDVTSLVSEKQGSVLIGPGLGRNPETVSFVRYFLSEFSGKVVIDADALFALSEESLLQKPKYAEWILTPHPGELKTLTGIDSDDRLTIARNLASQLDATILSKGLPSVIVSENQTLVTGYDTRIFSRAGFGDVLAGKTAGFWLQEKKPELAAVFALLDGKEKADHHILSSNKTLEPLDLI
ncbi:MAG: NAD(P)H-hydrate dehydratase [Balneolaceae bacterium]|nr:NAD(P)H-hydrate dehydratase [Balneolaceae bacterium]MBO6546012.1 NAD(P)H-hydrate dehydratase [Balneolaceae bacterium]MBO6647408.1 NAD(P)H-hydrate dehydratase [Balneolaceae bacterium]